MFVNINNDTNNNNISVCRTVDLRDVVKVLLLLVLWLVLLVILLVVEVVVVVVVALVCINIISPIINITGDLRDVVIVLLVDGHLAAEPEIYHNNTMLHNGLPYYSRMHRIALY